MNKVTILLLLTLICAISRTSGIKFRCQMIDYGNGYDYETCTMPELSVTREDNLIEPEAENPEAVKEIQMKNSHMPILSKGICKALPNFEIFIARNCSIEEIEDGAFEHCKKVRNLLFPSNNFKKLDRETFKGKAELQRITLIGGNIPVFDLDLIDSRKLIYMDMSNLSITVFNTDTLLKQRKLENLFLHSNNLFDLDVEKILKYAPKLKAISLWDNNFKCSRLDQIRSFLSKNNVKYTNDCPICYTYRQRDYIPEIIEETHCLTDDQWESEIAKIGDDLRQMVMKLESDRNAIVPEIDLGQSLQNLDVKMNKNFEALEKKFDASVAFLTELIKNQTKTKEQC